MSWFFVGSKCREVVSSRVFLRSLFGIMELAFIMEWVLIELNISKVLVIFGFVILVVVEVGCFRFLFCSGRFFFY